MSPQADSRGRDSPFITIELPDEPAPDEAEFEAAGLSGDRPTHTDLLGVQPYADALAKFVLHPDTEPLVIGIHGPWGKGKSSFMGFIKTALARERRTWDAKVVPIEFNAWRFQDSRQIWAGLASEITETLEAELGILARMRLRARNAWSRRRSEVLTLSLTVTLALALLLIFALIPDMVPRWIIKLFESDTYLKLSIGGGGGALILLWRLPRLLQPLSQRILEYGSMPNYRDQMGYQHRVLADIQRVHRMLRQASTKRGGPPVRVVVFIDDLDRCSEEKIVDILQAINLILGASEFFVFLGVASEMLQSAIRYHYAREGETLDDDFPQKYLEKIIQLSFRLPNQKPDEQKRLITHLFSKPTRERYEESEERSEKDDRRGSEVQNDGDLGAGFLVEPEGIGDPDQRIGSGATVTVQDTEYELRTFLALHRFLDDNPRVKKHVINVHRLVKILLQEPGTTWSRERQQQIVIWLIFCHRWSRQARELLDDAASYAGELDCLAAWRSARGGGLDDGALEEFILSAKPPLPGDELGEDGFLRRAMEISRMAHIYTSPDGAGLEGGGPGSGGRGGDGDRDAGDDGGGEEEKEEEEEEEEEEDESAEVLTMEEQASAPSPRPTGK